MNNSLVSIIIPTYNRAHLISETLHSIIAQTYTYWECIVVDDGSTDNTEEILKNYIKKDKRFQYHQRPKDKPKGANACRNYGISISNGDFLLVMDSDDLLHEDCLTFRSNLIKEKKNDFVIFKSESFINEISSKPINYNTLNIEESNVSYLSSFLKYDLPWNIMCVLWKRKVFEKYSYDENLQRLQDVDFHIRVLLDGNFSFLKISNIDNYYRKVIDESEKNTKEFKIACANSFYYLFEKINAKIDKNNKIYFRVFILKFIFKYYLIKHQSIEIKLKSILRISKQNNYFTSTDVMLIRFLYFQTKYNIIKKKGIGMTKIRKQIRNYMYHKYLNEQILQQRIN